MRAIRNLGLAAVLAGAMACSANEQGLGVGSGNDSGTAAGGAGGSGGLTIEGGPSGDESDAPVPECRNVDILFAIDNSASMADDQQSLINSFPGFVAQIKEKLAFADSYHVGIVTTDDYQYNAQGCRKIGNLVTQTGGFESSKQDCGPFANGRRYMDDKEPDLASKFACAAKVGSGGNDDERMARAILEAIKPENNAPGTCNDGFSRLDSLLIVVLITDEDDWPDVCDGQMTSCGCQTCGSGGDPDAWYNELVSYKGDIAQNIVVLSLIGLKAGTCAPSVCAKLIGFTNRFGENAYKGDVCEPSYDSFFAQTLPVIDKACEKYIAPNPK
ncbi:MAG: hypothetical protein HY898_21900 [Deltaproteobacteria bacterium]|nr:hypothetical protein [Deltaproteobacteria bacterium]